VLKFQKVKRELQDLIPARIKRETVRRENQWEEKLNEEEKKESNFDLTVSVVFTLVN
jgi:hypothetical protein